MELHVDAVELYGSVRGANFPKVMKCSDSHFYVVKKQNSIHGKRAVANELLASLLLKRIGISTPEPAIVNCSGEFLRGVGLKPPERIILGDEDSSSRFWRPGLSFGSRIEFGGWKSIEDSPHQFYLPDYQLRYVKNLSEFIDIAAFDAWCCNMDARQAVFVRPIYSVGYKALFIDHGMCFGGRNWNLELTRRHTVYNQTLVYESVYGFDAFMSVMERIYIRCSLESLQEDASLIPREWYKDDERAFDDLLSDLASRRKTLPFLIDRLCQQKPNPFLNWSSNWKHHPQNAFLPSSFVKIPVRPMRRKMRAEVA